MQYAQVTVSASGTIVLGSSGNPRRVLLSNQGTVTVFIGDRSVSPTTGFAIVNGGTPPPDIPVTLAAGEELDATVAAGANTGTLHVLVNGDK